MRPAQDDNRQDITKQTQHPNDVEQDTWNQSNNIMYIKFCYLTTNELILDQMKNLYNKIKVQYLYDLSMIFSMTIQSKGRRH